MQHARRLGGERQRELPPTATPARNPRSATRSRLHLRLAPASGEPAAAPHAGEEFWVALQDLAGSLDVGRELALGCWVVVRRDGKAHACSLQATRDSSLSPYRGIRMPVDEIEVRLPRPEEYAAAGAVTALAYHEFAVEGDDGWSWYLEHLADISDRARRTTVLVAVASETVIGTATLELEDRVEPQRVPPLRADEAHLRMVGVHPDHRRRGIARRMVLECIELARDHGKRRLTLETQPTMSAARALYESLGFQQGPTREVEAGFLLVTYELAL